MNVAIISLEKQKKTINEQVGQCLSLIEEDINNNTLSNTCPRVWDGIMCWPPTENGTTSYQACPDYINGFNINARASRQCDSNGEWWINPVLNDTWTNLTQCMTDRKEENPFYIPEVIAAHMQSIRLMYNIGYGISLASLVLAVIIMLYFKRLNCPRNTIHINLFTSFIFRAAISFVKENTLVNGVGFSFDVERHTDGTMSFLDNGSHWQCKIFFSVFNYVLGANYTWIFTEGIYLHMLITVAMFSEKSGIKKMVTFGWGAPALFVVPWIIVRATLEDTLCWNTHDPKSRYFWLIRGPIVAAMGINFLIFLNIIRILFTKLTAFNTPVDKRYRKLAKSTLVLIPLFGVHYIVFIGLPDDVDQTIELVKLYYEMFFNSFQGFFVSLLFCFLNGEVQMEIHKKWNRFQFKCSGSGFSGRDGHDTMASFVSRNRSSIASSEKETPNGNIVSNKEMHNVNGGHSDCLFPLDIDTNPIGEQCQPMVMYISASVIEDNDEAQSIINNNTEVNSIMLVK